jgi:DNA-directed RNA polymerase beta subunit
MYPAYARLHRIDYNVKVKCQLERIARPYDQTAEDELLKRTLIPQYNNWVFVDSCPIEFELPCMVKTNYCNTTNLTAEEMLEIGEDPETHGAYIILGGLKRHFPYVDKPRKDLIFVLPPSKDNKIVNPWCKQTVDTPTGTAQNQIILDKRNVLRFQSSSSFGKQEVAGVANSVNILHVITLLLRYTPPIDNVSNPLGREILYPITSEIGDQYQESGRKMLLQNSLQYRRALIEVFKRILRELVSKIEYAKIMLIITDTITDFERVNYDDTEQTLFKWLKVIDKSPRERRETMIKICTKDIFPNIDRTKVDDKIRMICIMAVKLVKVKVGLANYTSRDSWGDKYLLTAGSAMSGIFQKIWNGIFRKVKDDVIDEIKKKERGGMINDINDIARTMATGEIFKTINGILTGKKSLVKASKKLSPIAELLEQGGPLKVLVLLCKIASNINTNSKNLRFRGVQSSQPYYVCINSTPDDQLCGITKFKAITAIVTIHDDFRVSLDLLMRDDYIVDQPRLDRPTPVLLNGTYVGWCDGKTLYTHMAEQRRTHRILWSTSFFMSESGFFEIYSNAGRLIRPVLVVNSEGRILVDVDNRRDLSFAEMVNQGYVVFIGPDEGDYLTIAARPERLDVWRTQLANANRDIGELDLAIEELQNLDGDYQEAIRLKSRDRDFRQNTADRLRRNPYHYCALHPISLFAPSAALAPYTNHNAGCRATYHSKMAKQALSLPLVNEHHADLALSYVTHPIVDSALSRELQPYPNGDTVIVAFLADYKTQEDAIVVNARTVDQGKFRYIRSRVIHTVITNTNSDYEMRLQKPTIIDAQSKHLYSNLTRYGLPAINAYLKEDDRVIGLVQINKNNPGAPGVDKSIAMGIGESGYVHDVIVREGGSSTKVSVLTMQFNKPTVGDKFTSRYSQKVTIGAIRADADMPYVASGPNIGQTPDFIVNPHSIPSRMTIGMLIETLTGKTSIVSGEAYDATSFDFAGTGEFQETLLKHGFHPMGSERLRDGATGEIMESWIYMGPIYYYQLPHIASSKIQARGGKGPIDPFTRQATSGLSNEGGVRLGEMESDALKAHQAAEFLRERLFKYSDPYSAIACRDCGMISSYIYAEKKYKCPLASCENRKGFGHLEIPYSFLLMQTMLMDLGLSVRRKVETYEEYAERLAFERSQPVTRDTNIDEDFLDVDSQDDEDEYDDTCFGSDCKLSQ